MVSSLYVVEALYFAFAISNINVTAPVILIFTSILQDIEALIDAMTKNRKHCGTYYKRKKEKVKRELETSGSCSFNKKRKKNSDAIIGSSNPCNVTATNIESHCVDVFAYEDWLY
jgi:hypothetical protein